MGRRPAEVDEPVGLPGVADLLYLDALRTQAIRVRHHRVAVGGDAIAMKRRLHQPPLAEMVRIFAGQQPLAKQPPRALQAAPLDEVPVVCDEDVLNQMRVADEKNLLAAHAVGHDVAIGACQAGEERQRIAAAGPIHELMPWRKLRPGRLSGRGRRLQHGPSSHSSDLIAASNVSRGVRPMCFWQMRPSRPMTNVVGSANSGPYAASTSSRPSPSRMV